MTTLSPSEFEPGDRVTVRLPIPGTSLILKGTVTDGSAHTLKSEEVVAVRFDGNAGSSLVHASQVSFA